MPDPFTHHHFGGEVLASLDEEIRQAMDVPLFHRALQGPDPWSTIGFYGGRAKQHARRSHIMHKQKTGAFLNALTHAAKEYPAAPVFSVLAGVICHYCLDCKAHPYIIVKGGDYDGTPATRPQRGGHVRLERAIDRYYLCRVFHKKPWRVPLCKILFQQKQFPESLRRPMDQVFSKVYGWENGFALFNRALRDERRFYTLMQDPLGVGHYLLRLVSGGRTDFSVYSYYQRKSDATPRDFLNEAHRPWFHPHDPTLVSSDSFLDLFAAAKEEAIAMIRGAYAVIRQGAPLTDTLFENRHYSTGFDCEDPRCDVQPVYEPLVYHNA